MNYKRFRFSIILGLTLVLGLNATACLSSAARETPAIKVDPSLGGPNTQVGVSGTGFPANTELTVRLGPPNVGATPKSYGQAVSNRQGEFTLTFTMPGQWPDGTPITETELVIAVINEDGSLKAAASFNFEPQDCPVATTGTQLLINEEQGYCLLYPTGYDLEQPNETETVIFIGSLLNVEQPRAYIEVQEAAGRTAKQVADALTADFDPSLFNIQRTSTTIGGEEAIVLDHMPGQDINRQVVVVHEGRLYKLTFVPADEALGEVYTHMEELFGTVIHSFAFLP